MCVRSLHGMVGAGWGKAALTTSLHAWTTMTQPGRGRRVAGQRVPGVARRAWRLLLLCVRWQCCELHCASGMPSIAAQACTCMHL